MLQQDNWIILYTGKEKIQLFQDGNYLAMVYKHIACVAEDILGGFCEVFVIPMYELLYV